MKKSSKPPFKRLHELLEAHARLRNTPEELCFHKPDPLWVARGYRDERIALLCALFAYGNAKAIVGFLESLDFSLLEASEAQMINAFHHRCYRFQTGEDIAQLFITLRRIAQEDTLEAIFKKGYLKEERVMDGIKTLLESLYAINSYRSKGYTFLLGSLWHGTPQSTFKRWLLYLRWMVRCDHLDMGLWQGVQKAHLLLPLDVHTFAISKELGLLKRKSYDFKAVVEVSECLKLFDPFDPIKYDFALYRIGQEKRIGNINELY